MDDETQPVLNHYYRRLMNLIRARGGNYKGQSLQAVFDFVKQELPYSQEIVDDIEAGVIKRNGTIVDQKVGLKLYLEERGGVCRHQALFCAYLLERLCDEGFLYGKVSVDRNIIPGRGGHAWCRYTNSAGEVYILDVAQKFAGSLLSSIDDRRRWYYERPEEARLRK